MHDLHRSPLIPPTSDIAIQGTTLIPPGMYACIAFSNIATGIYISVWMLVAASKLVRCAGYVLKKNWLPASASPAVPFDTVSGP